MKTTKKLLLALILLTTVGFSVGIPVETAVNQFAVPAPVVNGLSNVWKLTAVSTTQGWSGTAFPIACEKSGPFWRVTLLTAGHCVDANDPNLYFSAEHDDGRYLMHGRTLAAHSGVDAGMVTFISFFPVNVREFDFVPLRFGDEVLTAGYPQGEGPYLTSGRFSGSNRISTASHPGSSGSPVATPDGRVVGVLVAGYSDWGVPIPFMVIMVPVCEIEEWVRLWI